MTDDMRMKLEQAGVDVAGAMDRFMNNDALLERFMKKFVNDTNYSKLLEAIDEKDADKAFAASHTLKGVCANLSLQQLLTPVTEQCELFRNGKWDEAVSMTAQVTEEYEKITAVIAEVFPG